MNIYIPEHLRKLNIIDQLYRLYSEYLGDEYWGPDVERSYNADFESLDDLCGQSDPVKYFLDYLKKSGGNKYEKLDTTYVANFLYCAKGLDGIIFKYCTDYLGFSNVSRGDDSKVNYTFGQEGSSLEDVVKDKIDKFFDALVFGGASTTQARSLDLEYKEDSQVQTVTQGSCNYLSYKEFKYENDN